MQSLSVIHLASVPPNQAFPCIAMSTPVFRGTAMVEQRGAEIRITEILKEATTRKDLTTQCKALAHELKSKKQLLKVTKQSTPKRFKRKDWAKEGELFVFFQEAPSSGTGTTIKCCVTDPLDNIKEQACAEWSLDPKLYNIYWRGLGQGRVGDVVPWDLSLLLEPKSTSSTTSGSEPGGAKAVSSSSSSASSCSSSAD